MKKILIIIIIAICYTPALFSQQCLEERHSTDITDSWVSCQMSSNPYVSLGNAHWILYNFNTVENLYESTIWNINHPEYLDYGAKKLRFDYSLDKTNWTFWGEFDLAQAMGRSDYLGETGPDFNGLAAKHLLVTVLETYGDLSCAGLSEIKINTESAGPAPVAIDLAVWLEGTYNPNTGQMTNGLEQIGLLPSAQPYNAPPWNYAGSENHNSSDVVDWLLVSFRTSPAKEDEIAQTVGLLETNGTVYFPDENVLSADITSPLYIVVEHRNHMGIMSPQPLTISNNTLSYDFRAADSYIGAGGVGQKLLNAGTWAMVAGDMDPTDTGSYDVNGADKAIWQSQNGLFNIYLPGDLNQDGDTNGGDKAIWISNNGSFSSVPK